MTTRRTLAWLFAAALLALPALAARAAESNLSVVGEKSLLTPDGTLYVVRAGLAANLGIAGDINPTATVIEWTSRRQDGTVALGLVPGTVGQNIKRNLDLAYDESSGSLILLWKEEVTILNYLHLAVLRNGVWSQADFLPDSAFTFAFNPRMLLSHQTVRTQDADGRTVAQTRSILSLIWWEDSQDAQARYAPIFLDETVSSSDVVIYDLPSLAGGGEGRTSPGAHSSSSYMYPALQLDGPSGAILASFADLNADKQFVLRITYPDDLGRPGPTNATWLRRRIPVVGVTSEGPIADTPVMQYAVSTVIGASYKPTLLWRGDNAVGYTRFDGKKWSSVKTIPLDDSMSYDRALRLVEEMATKN